MTVTPTGGREGPATRRVHRLPADLRARIEAYLRDYPDSGVRSFRVWAPRSGPPIGKPVSIRIECPDFATAESLGLDPRAFVLAMMFAASNSFATPVGYQTNTMIYGPGGYKFLDFIRIGLPLNLLMAIASTCFIYFLWGV